MKIFARGRDVIAFRAGGNMAVRGRCQNNVNGGGILVDGRRVQSPVPPSPLPYEERAFPLLPDMLAKIAEIRIRVQLSFREVVCLIRFSLGPFRCPAHSKDSWLFRSCLGAAIVSVGLLHVNALAQSVRQDAETHKRTVSQQRPTVEHYWSSGSEVNNGHSLVPGSFEMDEKDAELCAHIAKKLSGVARLEPSYDSYGISILPQALNPTHWQDADTSDYSQLKQLACRASVPRKYDSNTQCAIDFKTSVETDDGKATVVLASVNPSSNNSILPGPTFFFQNRTSLAFEKGESEILSPAPIMFENRRLVAGWGRRSLSFGSDGEHPRVLRVPNLTIDVGTVGPDGLVEPIIGKVCEISFSA